MNYTNPNNPEYEDKPEDWLNSALIFARTLSLILKENEGIVVDIVGDTKFSLDPSVKKVIVFNSENQMRVIECEKDLEEGTWIMMHTGYNLN